MDYRRIDASFIHELDCLGRIKPRYLTVCHIARQTAAPQMDLSVHNLHRVDVLSIPMADYGPMAKHGHDEQVVRRATLACRQCVETPRSDQRLPSALC
jgi:hypothetical protein